MAMSDDSIVKIMQTLGLNYTPAINSTKLFEARIAGLNQQLFQLKANALAGARNINQAFSSQLGQMAGTKTIVDQFGRPLKTVQTEASRATNTIQSATRAYQQHGQSVQDLTRQYSILGNEFQRRASWFLTGAMFYGTIRAAKETVTTISEVEMGMTEIARIMDDSTFVFKNYRDELLQLGIDYGQTFDTVQDIAVRWAQAGYNVSDSLELTKTALLALNTAELDATYATQGLIAIMSQWNLTSQELLPILDKINKTADDFSITTQDIIDGLNRSGAAAKNMNMSIEETIGVITALREASGRTGKEVGNALNTIISYMQRTSSINVMEKMGINVFADEAKTQFVNVLDLFEQISQKWNDPNVSEGLKKQFEDVANEAGLFNEELAVAVGLQDEYNDLQKRDLAQSAAGVRRRNYFISLMERFSRVQEVVNNMTDAAGYSMRENERTMDTLAKKYKSLKAAAEQLAVALGDAGLLDSLKDIVDGLTGAASSFAKLDDSVKAATLTILELLAALGTLKGVAGLFTTKNLLLGEASLWATAIPVWGQVAIAITAVAGALALFSHNMENASNAANGLLEKHESLKKSFNSQIQAAEEAKENMLEQAKSAEVLTNKLDELTQKENLNVSEKAQMQAIIDKLNTTFPNLTLKIDEQTGKIVGNTNAIRDNIQALKDQAIAQGYQQKMSATASAYVDQEALLGQTQNEIELAKSELNDLQAEYKKITEENNKNIISDIRLEWKQVNINKQINEREQTIRELTSLKGQQEKLLSELDQELGDWANKTTSTIPNNNDNSNTNNYPTLTNEYSSENLKKLLSADKINLQNYLSELRKIKKEKYFEYLNKSAEEINAMLNDSVTAEKTKEYLSLESEIQSASNKYIKSSGENKSLENALKLFDHQKNMNQISIKEEIAYLNKIKQLYVQNSDELMDIQERIYDAQNSLMDERLQNSIDWINEKKSLNELSTEEEIAAWKRVKDNQSNNIEAVKKATMNLYDLRQQLAEETYSKEANSIEHWAKLGIYSIQEQIDKYKELYSFTAKSQEEEYNRTENLFNLYKQLLDEQQNEIKDAYDKRIQQIEDEASAKKSAQEDIIDGIEKELELLDKQEEEYSHDKKMADLKEQLAYWQVRTSEDARQKIADLTEQIAEEEHDREVELKRQQLEKKKDIAENEVNAIENAANKEKEKYEKSYKLIEEAFDEHSTDIVALAATMSKEAYEQWESNYLIPLQEALESGDYDSLDSISSNLSDSLNDLSSETNKNSQIYQAAKAILALKKQYEYDGDITAAQEAIRYYNKLESLSPGVATQLHNMNYEQAKEYISNLPKAHSGGQTLSYGAVYMKPGELIFPPDLSTKLESLISVLYKNPIQKLQSISTTDNRKQIQIDKILNIERNYMEDEVDSNILSRELQRAIFSILL